VALKKSSIFRATDKVCLSRADQGFDKDLSSKLDYDSFSLDPYYV
jgi:hypothetical protein